MNDRAQSKCRGECKGNDMQFTRKQIAPVWAYDVVGGQQFCTVVLSAHRETKIDLLMQECEKELQQIAVCCVGDVFTHAKETLESGGDGNMYIRVTQ